MLRMANIGAGHTEESVFQVNISCVGFNLNPGIKSPGKLDFAKHFYFGQKSCFYSFYGVYLPVVRI